MAIITICRGTKSGGKALAECLADRLDYPVVSREVIKDAAGELGVSEQTLGRGLERVPRLWDRQASARRIYIAAVQAALAEHVAAGELIYHGRGGQLLLKGLPAVLRVRLIAPIGTRVKTLMEGDQMDQASAEEYIRDVDAVRARWVKMIHGEDVEDPVLYDMVINLKRLSIPSACAIIARTIAQPEFKVTPEVKAKLMDFRMGCRIKAALLTAAETRALRLEVVAKGGVVQISGDAPALSSGRTGDQIVEIARSVPGVEEVRLGVQWYDPYP